MLGLAHVRKAKTRDPLEFVVSQRIKLTRRADFGTLDPLADKIPFSLIAATAALSCPFAMPRSRLRIRDAAKYLVERMPPVACERSPPRLASVLLRQL
jgi:hypothetical protein